MNDLLDTHAALWWLKKVQADSSLRCEALNGPHEHRVQLSGQHVGNHDQGRDGKLSLPADPRAYLAPRIERAGFTLLPRLAEHTYAVFSLPFHHLDAFDRLLIAQARVADLPIVTADRAFTRYDMRSVAW